MEEQKKQLKQTLKDLKEQKKQQELELLQSLNDFKIGDVVEWDEESYYCSFPQPDIIEPEITETDKIKNYSTIACKRIGYKTRATIIKVGDVSVSLGLRIGRQVIHYKRLFCLKKI
jgi:hypothetical protein